MANFQGKNLWRRIVYSRPALVLLLILVIVAARPVWRIFRRAQAVSGERQEVLAQVAELEARKAFLEREVARLQTDRGVEGEIRKKFSVAREGEKVITVVPEVVASSTVATSTSWWQKVLKLW